MLDALAFDFARRVLKDERRVRAKEHPDLILVEHEKLNIISVKDVREQITGTVDIRPYEAAYKLYIIREAEKMNVQAQNALLKTLEEPPAYTVIMLLAQNANVFLETILSRVVVFRAGESDAGAQFSALANTTWVQETIRMLLNVRYHTASDILAYIKLLHAEEVAFSKAMAVMELLFRDVLSYKCTSDLKRISMQAAESSIVSLAHDMQFAQLGKASDALEAAIQKLRFNVNEDLVMENLFLTLQEGS